MSENNNIDVTRIIPIEIEDEIKKSFIEYAMSVIADRALPDVRDGLKPVHRRILYAMLLLGFLPDKSYRKCATTVGEVLGKFHPHGDMAVYDSLVRMAQDFSLRYTLVDGHGNFGSRDGDSAAAMRYTESRLTKMAAELLNDINKDTVDFKPNFDDHEMEPVVLPARFPNLLVNGSSGIAVGMATNIPPHNLGEVIDGIYALIDDPEISIEELNEHIKGPDFPTHGIIIGKSGIREAYKTGKGQVVVRSLTEIEETAGGKTRIIVKEIPYQVNKARLIEKIAELVKDKKLDGIADINDESDRNDPVRIVITLKRDANVNVTLNRLFKHTQMQSAFNVNMLALVPTKEKGYEPKTLTLKQALEHYIEHQVEVIRRRTKFDLDKAEARAHVLEGLIKAVDILDEVIATIRQSGNEPEAKTNLMEKFDFSDRQAQAIVDMRLGRLTGLEILKLQGEYDELKGKIEYYTGVLSSRQEVEIVIKEELAQIKKKYADERRTKITAGEMDFEDEDLIPEETVAITLTNLGYIKRLPVDTYKSQRRGGRGITGLSTREEDYVVDLFLTSTHSYILFFTSNGKVFKLKGYQIPEAGRTAKGTAVVNLLQLEAGEKITTVIPLPDMDGDQNLIMSTLKGTIKKTPLKSFANIRKGGIIAITLIEDDELITVKMTDGNSRVFLATALGMSITFHESDVRKMGRTAQGVMGIRLADDDNVIGMEVVSENETILSITENGFGKRTYAEEYSIQKRGGKGILNYRVTEKTGNVVGTKIVSDEDDILLISTSGIIIRMASHEISILGRATQGVTLMRTDEENKVVSMAKIVPEDEEEYEEPENEIKEEIEEETFDEAAEGDPENETEETDDSDMDI
ncbi:MAG: DNA gyrase subunit A [Clostridia bacterium]|nr:DNA gyrase subunit A [Clostridia bacterium]